MKVDSMLLSKKKGTRRIQVEQNNFAEIKTR